MTAAGPRSRQVVASNSRPIQCALRALPGLLVVALIAAAPAVARAQVETRSSTAFSVERFVPAPGAGRFLTVQEADVLPAGAFAVGAAASLMARPIILRALFDGSVVLEPVATRLGLDLTAAVGAGTRYQLGAAVPIVVYQAGDRLRGIGLDERALAPVALGDVRLQLKARLVGAPGTPGRAVAVAFGVTLPTGNEDHFAGEAGPVYETRLVGSFRGTWLSAGAELGARIRATEVVLLSPARPHGNELLGALATAAVFPGLAHLSAAVEVVLVRADGLPGTSVRGPSPGEVRGGLFWTRPSGLTLGLGAGAGISPDDVGSPAWRLMTTARFESRPTTDLDRDGVSDGQDLCRTEPEDRDGFQDQDGCPDPDNDQDGHPDIADQCPDQPEDYDGYRDVDGCPDDQR